MKILIVNYRYYPAGGPEKYMFNISRLLEANGHEVIPFSTHSSMNMATPYEKYFVDSIGGGDAFHYEEYKKTPRVIKQLLERSIYSPEVKKAIQKEIRETKPDLVLMDITLYKQAFPQCNPRRQGNGRSGGCASVGLLSVVPPLRFPLPREGMRGVPDEGL